MDIKNDHSHEDDKEDRDDKKESGMSCSSYSSSHLYYDIDVTAPS